MASLETYGPKRVELIPGWSVGGGFGANREDRTKRASLERRRVGRGQESVKRLTERRFLWWVTNIVPLLEGKKRIGEGSGHRFGVSAVSKVPQGSK